MRACQGVCFTPWGKVGGIFLMGFLLMGAQLKPGELMLSEAIAYRLEGRRYQKAGNLHSAAAAYQKAIFSNPAYADVYNDLGIVLESLGDFTGAENAYTSALKLNPRLVGVHSNLALLYERLGKLDEAAAHWTDRVKSGPPNDPWVLKAHEKLKEYRFPVPESSGEITSRVKHDIREATQAGQAHLEAGEWNEAVVEFERVLVLDPKNSAAISGIRRAQAKLKDEEARKAKQAARRVKQKEALPSVKAAEPSPDAKALAQEFAREKARKQEEAKRQRQEAQPRKEGKTVDSTVLIDAQQLAKELALEKSRERAVPPPASPESKIMAEDLTKEKERSRHRAISELLQRGVAAMREGRYEEATVHYEQALVLDPHNEEAGQGLKRAQTALAKSKGTEY